MQVSGNPYSRIFDTVNGLNRCHFFVAGSVYQVCDRLQQLILLYIYPLLKKNFRVKKEIEKG